MTCRAVFGQLTGRAGKFGVQIGCDSKPQSADKPLAVRQPYISRVGFVRTALRAELRAYTAIQSNRARQPASREFFRAPPEADNVPLRSSPAVRPPALRPAHLGRRIDRHGRLGVSSLCE